MDLTAQGTDIIWDDEDLPALFQHLSTGAKQVARALLNARLPMMPRGRAEAETWADLVRGGLHLAAKA